MLRLFEPENISRSTEHPKDAGIDGPFACARSEVTGEKTTLIKQMMEAQMCLLWADLSEPEPDAAEIARRAETLYHFATCLRDFPELPNVLQSRFSRPPECFEGFLPESDQPATD